MDHEETIVHGDLRSANILLGKNWEGKIAYFGISKLHPTNQEANTNNTNDSVATQVYWCPVYEKTRKLKKESDIYSLGVILFEIFCGRLAYDPIYMKNDKGLTRVRHKGFIEKTLRASGDILTSYKGPDQDSLRTFLVIAGKCLEEIQDKRPTIDDVIKQLEIALNFQISLKISVEDIKSATGNFSQKNCIKSERYWKAYKGEVALTKANANTTIDGRTNVVAKWFDSRSHQGDIQFLTELEILFRYKHENIIGLVRYCDEPDEKIIIFKHESKGSLEKYLNDPILTWIQRLKICNDIACGLQFLHHGNIMLSKVVHRNLKSTNIVINDDWKAKISNLELSSLDSSDQEMEDVSNDVIDRFGYLDPEYAKLGFLSDKSDIYSFGVILFEILCGRLAWIEDFEDHSKSLVPLAKRHYKEGTLDEVVFGSIQKQIDEESLTTFADIAYKCLEYSSNDRPTASEVVNQLKKALEFQEDKEIWGPKLPINYKKILEKSKNPTIYSTLNKKNLYVKLCQGILLQEGKEWFSLSSKGKGNAMISATKFSYENHKSVKWRSMRKSRFPTVAKLMDISNLKIQIKLKTEVLSLDVVYGVHLVFKFCEPRKFSNNLMYVNLKYKMGGETLHAYFAKQRDDDGWMMIELLQFLNQNGNTDFEVSLESLSRYYCGSGAIYVQGIEFLAIENACSKQKKHKENKKLVEAQQVPTDTRETLKRSESSNDVEQIMFSYLTYLYMLNPFDENFLLIEVNGKNNLMLSAEKVLYNSPKLHCFHWKRSSESRFRVVAELSPRQVFRIKYKINGMLTPSTEHVCYLVFKLSESCHGLNCPVKVRDLLQPKNKETKILYFRSPTPLNQHDNWIPELREDGWMEVMVWKFNTKNLPGKNDIPMNLKLITYEGTMSGLIICGLEFRPIL